MPCGVRAKGCRHNIQLIFLRRKVKHLHCPPLGMVSIQNVSMGDPACNAVHMLSGALHFERNCKM